MRNSWRFNFIDKNLSQTPSVNEGTAGIIGYMTVRAPKGTTEATYFPPGNAATIEALIGQPSANWPDIYEAIEFNKNYGLYISAPAGNSTKYKSYYGGAYFTSEGLVPSYKVEDKDNPNFLVYKNDYYKQVIGDNSPDKSKYILSIELNGAGKQGKIHIGNIPAADFAKIDSIDFNFWGTDSTPKGLYTYTIDKSKNEADGFPVNFKKDESSPIKVGTAKYSDGAYTITLGIEDDTEKEGVPFINFLNLVNYEEKILEIEGDQQENLEKVQTVQRIILGKATENDVYENTTTGEIYNNKTFIVSPIDTAALYNIKDKTYAYICQLSQTTDITNIKLSNISYDKYKYDCTFPILALTENIDLNQYLDATDIKDNYNGTKNVIIKSISDIDIVGKVYQWKAIEDEEGNEKDSWEECTSEFITQKIFVNEVVNLKEGKSVPKEDLKDIINKIYKVRETNSVAKIEEMTVDNKSEDLVLEENIKYNSFTLSCSETDYFGNIINGGEWTGSLSETGVDQYGAINYWEDILPYGENNFSATYIEVHPFKTFDDDTLNGVYIKDRIVENGSSNVKNISGSRCVSELVNENIKKNELGGTWNPGFNSIIKAGLVEATKPKYNDVSIFMEVTGNNDMKKYLPAIRNAHLFPTIISHLSITPAQASNVQSIPVEVRGRGIAYTVGEFQFRDKNTRKKYWSGIVGSYGAMLAKIMDQFYGGVAPAWKNDRGVGGELTRDGVLKSKFDFDDMVDTKILDSKGLNPVLLTSDGSIMVVSQKTTELEAGDWSYLGHSMSFDICKREIRDDVMTPQLMKPIDNYWIKTRSDKVDEILNKRLTGSQPIWTQAVNKTKQVNTDLTKARRTFVISVFVKVSPFSEGVELIFTNVDQSTILE